MNTKVRTLFILVLSLTMSNCMAWPGSIFALFGGGGGGSSLLLLGGEAEMVGLEISPASSTTPKGVNINFKATALYSDGSTRDVTSSANWGTDNTTITINSGTASTSSATPTGAHGITAAVAGFNANATLTVNSAQLQSLAVTPPATTIANGFSRQFRATGFYSDGTAVDITSTVSWSSSNTGAITITSNGNASAISGTGTSTITATLSGQSSNATATASSASLTGFSISPASSSIAVNTTQQYVATATFSDSTTQIQTLTSSWSSSNTTYATVDTSTDTDPGLARATSSPGTTQIRAKITGTFASCGAADTDCASLTVQSCSLTGITVTPNNPIAFGTDQQFKATGNYSNCPDQDITNDVIWTSSNTSVATISNTSPNKGLANSVGSGTTTITATKGAVTGDTSLEVRIITLTSISISPSSATLKPGDTQSFSASGTYSDGTVQDLTSQVVWSSSDSSVAWVDNSPGYKGESEALTAGTTTISATRDGVTGTATITVNADTTAPQLNSVIDSGTTYVTVEFTEDVNVTQASDLNNWKVVDSVSGACGTGNNFTGSTQTSDYNISSVTVISPKRYKLNFDASSQQKTYYVLANNNSASSGRIRDLADTPNYIGCPNSLSFAGQDGVKPYLLNVISTTPTALVVTFSEAVKMSGGGTDDATVASNWSIVEAPADGGCTDPTTISSITALDTRTVQINLNWSQCAIRYEITAASTLVDTSTNANTMGSPRTLSFTGNEQIKLVSAVATSLTTVELTFSKPVKSDAACSSISDCAQRYKFSTSTLGNITQAIVGTGTDANKVILTHQTDQQGFAYTVIVANNLDGDGFDNTSNTFKGVRNSDDTQYVQAAPKDRATFVGQGDRIDEFQDGAYYSDPFQDGSVFSFAFNYDGKVYLGTNDKNNAAFRFEPSGVNSTLVTFRFTAGTCSQSIGFGYVEGGSCDSAGTIGPNSEYGTVGFNSVTSTISATDYELLYVGTLRNGVNTIYYSQSKETELTWKQVGFSVTGGGNTKSIQTIEGHGDRMFFGFSSPHSQQAPIISTHSMSESSGDVTLASGTDVSVRSLAYLGKQGSPQNPCKDNNSACVVGIDSMLSIDGTTHSALFGASGAFLIANNGGIAYATSFAGGASTDPQDDDFSLALSFRPDERTNTTLALPNAPAGLGKISPGQRGVPFMVIYKNTLYVARNLASADNSAGQVVNGGAELWKCSSSCGTSTNWSKVFSSTDFDADITAISLLQVNGDYLYVGFDNPTDGIQVYRTSDSSLTGSGNFTQRHTNGFGDGHTKIFSSTSINDGISNYIYVVVGTGSAAINVYREVD